MREVSRGGTLVAATIAALQNRTQIVDKQKRSVKKKNSPHASRRRAGAMEAEETPEEGFDETPKRLRRRRPAQEGSVGGGQALDERPRSTASEASARDSTSLQSSEADDAPALCRPTVDRSSDSDSPEEESTVKCNTWSGSAASTGDSTSSSDDDAEGPPRPADPSTRCDGDFKWILSDKGEQETRRAFSAELNAEAGAAGAPTRTPVTGSLDRRRRRDAAGPMDDRGGKSRSTLSLKPPSGRPPRPRPAGYEADPYAYPAPAGPYDPYRRANSFEQFEAWRAAWGVGGGGGGGGGGWWPPASCCPHYYPPAPGYPPAPHYSPAPHRYRQSDADERVRRLEADKESLQLQASVLAEQVAAQGERLTELERALAERKTALQAAEERLQTEMLQRSSLETQKLELMSALSELRLRHAALERAAPYPPHHSPAPHPRTPPANYNRQIERNTQLYASLPRHSPAPADARTSPRPAHVEREEGVTLRAGSPARWLRRGGSGGALEGEPDAGFARGGVRATAAPRLLPDNHQPKWATAPVSEWDGDVASAWLESLGLEAHAADARRWLQAAPGALAAATPQALEKELCLKHPMHRKKIVLALMDLQGTSQDGMLRAAGRLDCAWALRWLEDAGLPQLREAAAAARLDGRALHRLAPDDLAHSLHVASALHALSIRRGIQVLRDNHFSPDTMIRRATPSVTAEAEADIANETSQSSLEGGEGQGGGEQEWGEAAHVARWSSHRVMEWLRAIDLSEYAPNLRGAGVHGGLMLLEPRFTAELLAALLNIPANKTLLRRHLTTRFNQLLGRDVIQEKREAEQTLGYQPLTLTTKYKVPKKSQFSLKRKKNKAEQEYGDLVCPLGDGGSGDANHNHCATMNLAQATTDEPWAASPRPDDAGEAAPRDDVAPMSRGDVARASRASYANGVKAAPRDVSNGQTRIARATLV